MEDAPINIFSQMDHLRSATLTPINGVARVIAVLLQGLLMLLQEVVCIMQLVHAQPVSTSRL